MDSSTEKDSDKKLSDLTPQERREMFSNLYADLAPLIEESVRRGSEAVSHLGGNYGDWDNVGFLDLLELGRMAQQYGLAVKRRKRENREKPGPKLPTDSELEAWAKKWARFSGSQRDFAELHVLSMRQMRHVIDFLKRRANS